MLITALPFQAHAAWLLEPVVGTYVEYETNPRMRREDEDEATALLVSLALPMSYETQRTTVLFKPRTVQSFYAESDDEDLERDNWYLPLTYSHKFNLSQIGLGLSYSDLSVRTSEQESPDSDDPGSGDIRNLDDRQKRWSIAPSWSYQLSPKNQVSLEGSYTDIDYDAATLTSGRAPYDTSSISGSFNHQLSQKNTIGVIVRAGNFDAEGSANRAKNNTDSYSLNSFFSRQFSPRTSASMTLGVNKTDYDIFRVPDFIDPGTGQEVCFDFDLTDPDNPVLIPGDCERISDDDVNFVGDLQITRSGDDSLLTLGANQAIRPNSRGVTTVTAQFRANYTKKFTQRSDLKVGAIYIDQKDTGDVTQRTRDYLRADITYRFQLTREWYLRGTYQFTTDDQTGVRGFDQGSATNNEFLVGVEWRSMGWRWQ
jgi:hypothetical protein